MCFHQTHLNLIIPEPTSPVFCHPATEPGKVVLRSSTDTRITSHDVTDGLEG